MMTKLGEIDNFIEQFDKCANVSEQLKMFYKRTDVQQFNDNNFEIASNKSSAESARLKEEGNNLFIKGKFEVALERYNKAIMLTENTGQTSFSTLLGNRSAAFFNLRMFNFSLEDICLALEFECPEALQLKLIERKVKCLLSIGNKSESQHELKNLEEKVFHIPELQSKQKIVVEDLGKLLEKCKATEPSQTAVEREKTLLETRNQYFEGFSGLVEMQQSNDRGRFMVARENIPVGTIIGAENPITSTLLLSKRESQCYTCFKTIGHYFLPCLRCCEVKFCSKKCWSSQKKIQHEKLECGLCGDLSPILKEVKGGDSSPDYYRLCLLALADHSAVDIEHLLDQNEKEGGNIQRESSLISLLNLVGLENSRNLETDFWIFLAVSYFIKVLRHKKYFTKAGAEDTLSKQEETVGIFLVKVLRILQFNVHCIMQAVIKRGETFSMESIGCGIYSSMAFLNHSCNPNTIKYWEGDRMVLVASRTIEAGEEVADNYGMHFLNNNKIIRQSWLKVNCFSIVYCSAISQV